MSSPTIKNIFVQTEHLVFTGSFVAGSEYRKQDSGKHPVKDCYLQRRRLSLLDYGSLLILLMPPPCGVLKDS